MFSYANQCWRCIENMTSLSTLTLSFSPFRMLIRHYTSTFRLLSCLWSRTSLTLSTSSLTTLDMVMKRLIDSKQHRKALDLFEQQSALRTDVTVNMAMRACIALQDYQRGRHIIKHLPSQSLNNPFTQTSLIRFYSKPTEI